MKKVFLQENKGITLVALVISIIILLILATVSIGLINSHGIIGKVKDAASKYSEADFLEKVDEAIVTEAVSGKVNYIKVINKILRNLQYPKMDESGSQLEKEEDRTNYNGKITITAGSDYSYPESRNFKMAWDQTRRQIIIWRNDDNGEQKKYIWNNLIYAGVENLIVEGNLSDWKYEEKADGTIKIKDYIGAIDNIGDNFVIPNRINGKRVSEIYMDYNTKVHDKIKGKTATVSSGILISGAQTLVDVDTLILKDNVTSKVGGWLGYMRGVTIKKLEIGYGCEINGAMTYRGNTIYEDVEIEYGVKLGANALWGSDQLSEEKITDIIKKVKFIGNGVFGNTNFNNKNIVIPENKEIKNNIFSGATGISTITVKDNCKLSNNVLTGLSSLDTLIIGNNCEINNETGSTIIKEVKIGNNVNIGNALGNISLSEEGNQTITIGDECIITTYTSLLKAKNLRTLIIGDRFNKQCNSYTEIWYGYIMNATLERLIIGDEANIEGKLVDGSCTSLKEIQIGKKAEFTSVYNSGRTLNAFNNIVDGCNITFGEETKIASNTFSNSKVTSVKLYLTREQIDGEPIQPEWDAQLGGLQKQHTPNTNYILWTKTN